MVVDSLTFWGLESSEDISQTQSFNICAGSFVNTDFKIWSRVGCIAGATAMYTLQIPKHGGESYHRKIRSGNKPKTREKSLHWVLKWQWFTTLQLTNVSHQNSLLNLLKMIFLFPRWDMLIPWRVYLYGAETKTIQVKVNFFGEMISPVRPKAWRRFSEGTLRRSAW